MKTLNSKSNSLLRWPIFAIHLIVGLNALAGGYYGAVAGAPNVPLEWLSGSPFESYLIPSLILAIVVGGSSLVAAVMVLRRRSTARFISMIAAGILLVWIVVQVAMIGYVSWLQPAMAAAAVITFFLTRKLQPREF